VRILKVLLRASLISFITAFSSSIFASGYKLEFQSVSIMGGNGEAAALEDAATNWYNSAGLVYIPRQVVAGGFDLYAPTTFTGSQFAPSVVPAFDYTNSGSASSHPNSLIPLLHYNIPFKDRYSFGLSIAPAWGLRENYGQNSLVRYELRRIYTRTIDIAPSLAVKLNTHWSIGAGPDIHYFTVQQTQNVRTEPLSGAADSVQHFTAESWDTGWHAGILWMINETTRIGANYRSQIKQNMSGFSDFAFTGVEQLQTDHFKLNVLLPPVTTVSFYHDINPRLAILGTINYDQWGKVKAYNAKNIIEPGVVPGTSVLVNQALTQDFKSVVDYGLGMHYKLNDKIMLRSSVKYEPTPTVNEFRDISYPDEKKLGFQVGSRYVMNKMVSVDFVYGHVFVWQAPINYTNPLTQVVTTGNNRTHIDLVGIEAVVTI